MKKFITNIKTTIFGAIAGLPILGEGIVTKDIVKILAGIGTILVGLFAKDADTNE
jgi:hypothetical protein